MMKALLSILSIPLIAFCAPIVEPDVISKIYPNLNQQNFLRKHNQYMQEALEYAQINTCPRLAAFLAAVGAETAEGAIFDKHDDGEKFEGRKDLGNIQKGDGVRYRPRGALTIVGRDQYRLAGHDLKQNYENEPELVSQSEHAWHVAAWLWKKKELNALADKNDEQNLKKIPFKLSGCKETENCKIANSVLRRGIWKRAKQVLHC
eukprot:TRINITY_DN6203_c0_g1_i1.p2 TRINITY_DN6203_c0_g1~~TRINITY_DN6203_c0_g1_i1.p2  ORF type:complete len:205 (-),score=22.47 TRINITY_DN6203_c0_g1_i1:209-823(-)